MTNNNQNNDNEDNINEDNIDIDNINENNDESELKTKSAFVALIGKPNVGKSTLLNALVGKKISITADKPQTTRYKILGVVTKDDTQIVYVDTPGIHTHEKTKLNNELNRTASGALQDVDLVLWLVSAFEWTRDDELVYEKIKKINTPVVLIINKIDKVKQKEKLLPYLQEMSELHNFKTIIPLSALSDPNFNNLEKEVSKYLEKGPFYFDEKDLTNATLKFQLSEIFREKLVRVLRDELPYAVSVIVEGMDFVEKKNLHNIQTVIWVERSSQKAIVIGKQGEALKKMATAARFDMEKELGTKVYLTVLVKVKENWSGNTRDLMNLGLKDV